MTTPWERIRDAGFRHYLQELGFTADDYNGDGFDQGKVFNNYKQFQQQQQQQQQRQGSDRLSQTLLTQIWRSVLRLENTTTGELATGLVFDIFEDARSLFMLLLMNLHFNFKGDQLVRAMTYDAAGKVFLVESFTKRHVRRHYASQGQDFVIYRLDLNKEEWEMPEPGWVRRRLPAVAAPAAAAADVQPPEAKKRKKEPVKPVATKLSPRGTSGSARKPASKETTEPAAAKKAAPSPKRSERLKKHLNPNKMKADIIWKTPRYRYDIYHSMPVRIFGFPHTVAGRWEGTSTVTSIDRNTFGLQMFSAPGLSGGAVVATEHGEVIGIMGGNQDAQDNGKDQPFNAYAIQAHSFPERPSSNPPSAA